MSRTERREKDRRIQKLKKTVGKLTPRQLELIDLLAEQQTDQLLDIFKQTITESTIEAMRENRISIERAERIINRTNEIIEKRIFEDEHKRD